MSKGSPTKSKPRYALADAKTAPVSNEMYRRLDAIQAGKFIGEPSQSIQGMSFALCKTDELELTDLLKKTFPGIRFFDVGPNVNIEERVETVEISDLTQKPNQEENPTPRKSMIDIVWPEKGWSPDFYQTKNGNKILISKKPFTSIYHPSGNSYSLNQLYEWPSEYIAKFQQALIRGGAKTPHTYRHKDKKILVRATSWKYGELHVYFWPDIPESAAFGRKMLRLAKKVCPHYLYRVNPVTGEVGERVDRSTSGWFGKGLVERFRQDPNFWPKIWIPPKEYCDNPHELLEVWVPDTCLPDQDPLAFRGRET